MMEATQKSLSETVIIKHDKGSHHSDCINSLRNEEKDEREKTTDSSWISMLLINHSNKIHTFEFTSHSYFDIFKFSIEMIIYWNPMFYHRLCFMWIFFCKRNFYKWDRRMKWQHPLFISKMDCLSLTKWTFFVETIALIGVHAIFWTNRFSSTVSKFESTKLNGNQNKTILRKGKKIWIIQMQNAGILL